MKVSASQTHVPSRTYSTLSHTKESQGDDHLFGVHHGCG